jgi:dTDP-4-dehydrorhamnose reductase
LSARHGISRDRGAPIALWGGVEATVNRVGDRYSDQIRRSGHHDRLEDLDLFASLGIRAIRYPVLWERTAPDGIGSADWSWSDARLARLRELGIRPIVGLVHHGSGPRHTSVLDPGFADGLATFARAVAERYPWVTDFTPVNEPVSTARFAALYGHWHPHERSTAAFVQAVLIQCRAIARSMEAIRGVTPNARLVHTEDLGTVSATPLLEDQARYENERRFAAVDLLTGRLEPGRALYRDFRNAGITSRELAEFRERPTPPDVFGVNYYVTSDRFLDEALEDYPESTHGGNASHRYADIEAVRARRCPRGHVGFRDALRAAWTRYRLPVAVTEAHLGGTREEQMRWLAEAWRGAREAADSGADVRAVTAWALLGSFDWDSLVTRDLGRYEPGAFDVRSAPPRPTAIAALLRDLASGRSPRHPALRAPGWWRREDRARFPVEDAPPARPSLTAVSDAPADAVRPILVAGASGTLGAAFTRIGRLRGLPMAPASRADVDIADPGSVARILDRVAPWAVVNAAGYVRVDDAERDAARCRRENARGPALLARACAARGIRLLTFSSDLVFPGGKGAPYVETDAVRPLGVYGESKARAERLVLRRHPAALVVRTSAFFGPWDSHNFVGSALREIEAGRTLTAADDVTVSPTYVPDLVHAALDLLLDDERGIWHLAGRGAFTWAELARCAAEAAGLDARLVRPIPARALGWVAPRPADSVLGSRRGELLRATRDALAQYVRDVAAESARESSRERAHHTGTYD